MPLFGFMAQQCAQEVFLTTYDNPSPVTFNKVQPLPKALVAVIGAVVLLAAALWGAEVVEEALEGGRDNQFGFLLTCMNVLSRPWLSV
jgi:hypothetical protein